MSGKLALHKSPKRKLDATDFQRRTISTSPATSSSAASGKESHLADETSGATGDNSPQISVAGQLDDLDLQGPSGQDGECAGLGLTDNGGDGVQSEHQASAQDEMGSIDAPNAGPPTASKRKGKQRTLQDEGDGTPAEPSPGSHREPKSSPRGKPNSRRKSPPLASDASENPLTWHDSEITGYAPTDPNDDGYGLDGIGFKPTAAVAWERSQRRQKQVAEWKSRESKEARERRKSRRDGLLPEDEAEGSNRSRKKVKFDISEEG
ncbi:hypothetical protein FQN50_004769 [Emmonsiellopsis sp. PD_5]|nr:hypothetical protein FQN50_004769 [Emmonsiellopsis sp. PD_5]